VKNLQHINDVRSPINDSSLL